MSQMPNDTFAASFQPETHAQSVLIVTADNTQDLEFFYPYYRFTEAGYHVDVVTPDGKGFKGKQGMGLKETKAIRNVAASQYQLLYIPGGKAPAELMKNEDALALVRAFIHAKKPVASICHGAQLLAAAGVIQDKNIAAWPDVEAEITEAGGRFVNKAIVVDGPFITARWPGDLPLHVAAALEALSQLEAQQKKMARAS